MYLCFVLFVISVGLSEYIIYLLLMCYYSTGYLVFVGLYKYCWCCSLEINALWSRLVRGHHIRQRMQSLLFFQSSHSCLCRFVYSLFALNFGKLLSLQCGNFLKSVKDIYFGDTARVQTVHNELIRCAWKFLGQFLSLIMLASSRGRRWEYLV